MIGVLSSLVGWTFFCFALGRWYEGRKWSQMLAECREKGKS